MTLDNKKRDQSHLSWLHERLVNVHGENPNYDYMIRMREVIAKIGYEKFNEKHIAAFVLTGTIFGMVLTLTLIQVIQWA